MTDSVSRTALVTGASRGIGRATARALAHAGARVNRSLRQFHQGCGLAGCRNTRSRRAGPTAVGADLLAPRWRAQACGASRKLVGGKLDILVANAGIAVPASIEAQTVEDFDRMFAVNVRAPFFLVAAIVAFDGRGFQHRDDVIARSAGCGRPTARLFSHQGRHRYARQAFRRAAGITRYPCQRGSRRESSTPTCRSFPGPKKAATMPSVCSHYNASVTQMTSPTS